MVWRTAFDEVPEVTRKPRVDLNLGKFTLLWGRGGKIKACSEDIGRLFFGGKLVSRTRATALRSISSRCDMHHISAHFKRIHIPTNIIYFCLFHLAFLSQILTSALYQAIQPQFQLHRRYNYVSSRYMARF